MPNLDKLRYFHYTIDDLNKDFPLYVPRNKGKYISYNNSKAPKFISIDASILNDGAADLHKQVMNAVGALPACIIDLQATLGTNTNGNAVFNSSWGFYDPAFGSYNESDIATSLLNKKPVIVRSFYEGIFGNDVPNPFTGHVWVIDGVKEDVVKYTAYATIGDKYRIEGNKYRNPKVSGIIRYVTVPRTGTQSVKAYSTTFSRDTKEFHHNWGWAESDNSYATYKTSNWLRVGVFQSPAGRNFHVKPEVIVNITPR